MTQRAMLRNPCRREPGTGLGLEPGLVPELGPGVELEVAGGVPVGVQAVRAASSSSVSRLRGIGAILEGMR